MMNVEAVSDEPIIIPINGTTYKAARLSMGLMAKIGTKWREERINATLGMRRVMMMAPGAHIEFIAQMAAKQFDVIDLLRDLDLRRLCVQVACEQHNPKFNAGALNVETCSALSNEILIESELLRRPTPGEDNGADPTTEAKVPTGDPS